MFRLSSKWAKQLELMPETGMDYQVVAVVLKDGTRFDQVVVVEGCITQIRGRPDIPFTEDEIVEIVVTHERWDFGREK